MCELEFRCCPLPVLVWLVPALAAAAAAATRSAGCHSAVAWDDEDQEAISRLWRNSSFADEGDSVGTDCAFNDAVTVTIKINIRGRHVRP